VCVGGGGDGRIKSWVANAVTHHWQCITINRCTLTAGCYRSRVHLSWRSQPYLGSNGTTCLCCMVLMQLSCQCIAMAQCKRVRIPPTHLRMRSL
jgi:hypothetical protein